MASNLKTLVSKVKKKPQKRATSFAKLKLGDEPSFETEPTNAELVRALNWYNVCIQDPEVRKGWVTEFLSKHGWKNDEIRVVTGKIKKLVPTHSAIARMFNLEQPVDLKYAAAALIYFENVLAKQNEDDLDDEGNPIEKVSAAPKPNKNVGPLVRLIEEEIEHIMARGTTSDRNVYTELQAAGVSVIVAKQIKSAFEFQTQEFTELANRKCDPDLDEAYSHLFTKTRKALADFMTKLNADLDSFVKVQKATRKPRKAKPVKVEKLIKNLKFKAKDDEYKIASIAPEKLIGANVLWTFNTKYRILSYFRAGEGGLKLKGTTLQNVAASGQKKLRKPEQQLLNFTTGAVKALDKNFEAIKTTESVPNDRINGETVLLRVF